MFRAMRAVVAAIPRGRVATYGQIAASAGFPGAARQAAWALHNSRGLPWHRVVAAGGRIALTGEHGLDQRLRLESEGVAFRGRKVRMDLYNWAPSPSLQLGAAAKPGGPGQNAKNPKRRQ
jgi:methylated-DNA-protein-cysteine methyltransferase related protein